MSNLVFIQEQAIVNLDCCIAIEIRDCRVIFEFERFLKSWIFSSPNQALVAYEAIKKARCTDLGKFDFTAAEVKDIYDRIN